MSSTLPHLLTHDKNKNPPGREKCMTYNGLFLIHANVFFSILKM